MAKRFGTDGEKILVALRRVKPDGYRAPSTFSLLELETLCKA